MWIHKLDNVEIDLKNGHKYAREDLREGDLIIKYGNPIGHATAPIKKGEHIHTHNMKTNLSGIIEYRYSPDARKCFEISHHDVPCFMGYVRSNGGVGIRNDIFIVNTVGCVNQISERLAALTGAIAFPHPFGCSQLGEDQAVTQLILKGIVNHPNAAGVLVLGLGCENNNIESFKKISEVVECHFVTGKHNLLIKIYCFDHDHLMQVLLNTIQKIPYVLQTETQISLDQPIERQVWVKEYQNTSFSASIKESKKKNKKD